MCKLKLRNAEIYPPSRIARTNSRCPHMRNSSASILSIWMRRPRTSPSHGENPGSNPGGVTLGNPLNLADFPGLRTEPDCQRKQLNTPRMGLGRGQVGVNFFARLVVSGLLDHLNVDPRHVVSWLLRKLRAPDPDPESAVVLDPLARPVVVGQENVKRLVRHLVFQRVRSAVTEKHLRPCDGEEPS